MDGAEGDGVLFAAALVFAGRSTGSLLNEIGQ